MNEVLQQLILIGYGVWRRRWYALATTMIVSLIGLAVVWTIPNSYESSARISLDRDSLLTALLEPVTANSNRLQKLQIMRQTLISRPNLEKVIRRSGLEVLARDEEEIEELIENLAADIEITDESNNIYRFTYSSGFSEFDNLENAEMATRVVQSILQMIRETDLGEVRKDLIKTSDFIDSELDRLRRELDGLERLRTEFEQRNIWMIGAGQSFANRLADARAALTTTEAQLNETQLVRDSLQLQLEGIEQFVSISGVSGPQMGIGLGGASDLLERIALVERQLDALRARDYTDLHPDVVAAQRQLDNLRQRYLDEQNLLSEQEESAGDRGAPSVPTTLVPNPVYEATQIRLIERNGEIASLTGRRTQRLAALLNLEERAKSLPLLEREKNDLDRQTNSAQKLYDDMLKSKEELRRSRDIDTIAGGISYEIIDPPVQPLAPASPDRPILLGGVFFASIGAGLGLAFILSQAVTTFVSTRSLRDAFSLPVLGSISAIIPATEKKQQKMENLLFAGAYGVLFIGFSIMIFIEVASGPTI